MATYAKIPVTFNNSADYTTTTQQLDVDDNTTQYESDAIDIKYSKNGPLTLFLSLDAGATADRRLELGWQICHREWGTYVTPDGAGNQYKNLKDFWNSAEGAIEFTPKTAQWLKLYIKGDDVNTDTNVTAWLGFYEKRIGGV